MKIFFLGILTAFVSLWGGAYLLHVAPQWAQFATVVTAGYGFVVGGGLAIYGIVSYAPQDNTNEPPN